MHTSTNAQSIKTDNTYRALSAITGHVSKPMMIDLYADHDVNISHTKISGQHASYFKISSAPEIVTHQGKSTLTLTFEPKDKFIGIAEVELLIHDLPITVTGLSTIALEGENESPLAEVVTALGYTTDVGWTTLPNHLRPELQGEELAPAMFKKANNGQMEMIPVARYSPDFLLNFGYYTNHDDAPEITEVGVLDTAGAYPEHQILFPGLSVGSTTFDPGEEAFGFYATSPSHTIYSEDMWNIKYHNDHAAHAMRIYPVRDRDGNLIADSYLICMEEAANGDYNDYVFLLTNAKPVFQE